MKRIFLAAMLAFTALTSANAQLPYSLTTQTGQPYSRLSGATSINGTDVWDDDFYAVALPNGFNFKMGGMPVDTFYLDLSFGGIFSSITTATNGFMYAFGQDLADRGLADTVNNISRSPIRYQVTGTSPNRIFKAELANAGFYDEWDLYETLDDSLDIQIWLYETSNVVELRYGPSRITNPGDYFFLGGPLIGYTKNLDFVNETFDAIYNLSGNPASPGIDSIDINFSSINPLNDWPANGTVYRFAPIPVGLANGSLAGTALTVYPTNASDELNVRYNDEQAARYRIVSVEGAVVMQGELAKGSSRLAVAGLAPGTYALQVENATGRTTRRFTKR